MAGSVPSRGRLLPALLFLTGGCAGIPATVSDLPDPALVTELTDVPFHAQERYQCGPAALTTVLEASGAGVALDDIVSKVYIPGRKGSLQLEMLAATRTSGRLPYVIDGTLAAIAAELEAGRPVVVLQNLGIALVPRWHYAVVVGIDASRDEIVLRSGTDRRRITRTPVFLRTWRRSDFWAMTVLRPGELPTNADESRYVEAAVGLERGADPELALRAWNAALTRWPANRAARFGLGNALFAAGEFDPAVDAYRQLLAAEPGMVVARNNLALALGQLGRVDEALDEIDAAIDGNTDTALAAELADSRNEILALRDSANP